MATPSIPQRPARSQQQSLPTAPPTASLDTPRIPPRPKRNVERSVSPQRESFARSPLNDPSFIHSGKSHGPSNLTKSLSRDLPPRPPSVNLPLIGDEGNEYAHLDTPEGERQTDPIEQQTKNVAGDLPLHAPKASLPASSAKQRVAAVTRTDSSQAAALGIGKANSEADTNFGSSLARSVSSQAGSRPASLYKTDTHDHENEELGIPEIGLQVPMYPNAGDVQAPTPSPSVHTPSTGIGFFNNTGGAPTPRHHSRTKSGREVFQGPPGSYGLHGHGVNAKDPFEKAWYDKHPDVMAKEVKGEYGPRIQEGRKEWALSSEELNKLVHGKQAAPLGADRMAMSTPDEQIGFLASEEYTSRMNSPRPSSTKPRRPSSQTHAESPLRKMSFPAHELEQRTKDGTPSSLHDHALDSEVEDDTIHVDEPNRKISKIGGGGYDPPTQDLGPHGGNTEDEGGYVVETGYGVPILASDEVLFRPEAQYMQPAIEPERERRGSSYMEDYDTPPSDRRSGTHSRSNSIPTITHSLPGRFPTEERPGTGTPLEDLKEYEPLFPEEEEDRSKSAPGAVQALKRPDVLARHHFPSQDVWEDTPSSLMYQTTVDTPQLPDESNRSAEHEPRDFFESPEAEAARKTTITRGDQQNFLPDGTKHLAKTGLKAGVLSEVSERPGLRQRFPSQDIWEDSPESQNHTTTVSGPQEDEETTKVEPPHIPSRPAKKSLTNEKETSPTEERKAPIIPGRPKPQVPARPSKLQSRWSEEQVPLSKTISGGSAEGEPSATKAKPPVPARPSGGKIAALQANFMNDLNKRLQVGPVAPKKEVVEEEAAEEKAPLADARKGRARGPQRRKPGTSPSAAAVDEPSSSSAKPAVRFAIAKPTTLWAVDESGDLSVPAVEALSALKSISSSTGTQAQPKATPASNSLEVPSTSSKSTGTSTLEEPEIPLEKKQTPTYKQEFTPENEATTSKVERAASRTPEPITPGEAELEKKLVPEKKAGFSSTDSAVQTGQQDLQISEDLESGEMEKTTIYLGGRAPEPGSVVVKSDGTTHVGAPDGLGGIEKTGNGM